MNKITTLVLLAIVGGLLLLVNFQKEREDDEQFKSGEALLGSIESVSMRTIFIDHTERDTVVGLEVRDGEWWVEDPVEYPADIPFLKELLTTLNQPAAFVAQSEREALAKHFSPPRATIRLAGVTADGESWEEQVEVGPVDADSTRLLVRVRDRIMRVKRNLDTVLLRHVSDFRDHRIFHMDPANVVRVQRRGFYINDGRLVPLEMQAEVLDGTWMLSKPERVSLDDMTYRVAFLPALIGLNVGIFVNDDPNIDVERWGLAVPDFEIVLEDRSGMLERVQFGYTESGGYYCKHADSHHVFQINMADLGRVTEPWLTMLDPLLVHVFRKDLAVVDLSTPSGGVRLTQVKEGEWVVASRAADGSFLELGPAEPSMIQDMFGYLEGARVGPYLVDKPEETAAAFADEADICTLHFTMGGQLVGFERQMRFGAESTGPDGAPMDSVLRDGDDLVGLVAPGMRPFFKLEPHAWLAKQVWALEESPLQLDRLTMTHDGLERAFVRKTQGTWHKEPGGASASELYEVLDPLLFLRAAGHIPGEATSELVGEVTVTFSSSIRAASWTALFGIGPEDRVLVEVDGRRSILQDATLHARLIDLIGR
jgi:hypothetical protein